EVPHLHATFPDRGAALRLSPFSCGVGVPSGTWRVHRKVQVPSVRDSDRGPHRGTADAVGLAQVEHLAVHAIAEQDTVIVSRRLTGGIAVVNEPVERALK